MLTPDQLRDLRSTDTTAPNKVRLAMKTAKLTQVQLAVRTGIQQSHISAIMCGKAPKLPIPTARKLAQVFGCTIDDLFPADQRQVS